MEEVKKGKVVKVDYVDSYASDFGEMHNFAVAFEGDKVPYFITVKSKDKPGISVREEIEYEIPPYAKSEDGKMHKFATINGKNIDLIKIKKVQAKPGGKGFSRQPKTKEEYSNDQVSYAGGYATQIVVSRHTTGNKPEEINKNWKEIFRDILKELRDNLV